MRWRLSERYGRPSSAASTLPPVSRPGDIWVPGNHRLICGRCLRASGLRGSHGRREGRLVTDSPRRCATPRSRRRRAPRCPCASSRCRLVIESLEVDLDRLIGVFPPLGTLLASRYYPPDLGYLLASDCLRSVVRRCRCRSSAAFGVLVAIPLAWFSAHNVTPGRRSAYPIGRSLIVGSRAIQNPSGRCSS